MAGRQDGRVEPRGRRSRQGDLCSQIQSHRATKAAWEHLAHKPLTTRMQNEFVGLVFGQPGPDETERAKTIRKTREDRLAAILASPTSQVKGTKDTAFSLLHAVVEYIDHDRPTRSAEEGSSEESRFYSATYFIPPQQCAHLRDKKALLGRNEMGVSGAGSRMRSLSP